MRPTRIEDIEHVNSIEPHLSKSHEFFRSGFSDCESSAYLIDVSRVAVVKSSIWCATSTVNLVPQCLRGSFVDLIATRDVVHIEESVSEPNVVDRVAVVVKQDVAIEARVKDNVGVLLDVRSILVFVSAIVSELYTRQQRRDIVCVSRTDAVLDLAVSHPGQIARLSVE